MYHGLQIRFTRVTLKTNTGSYKKSVPRTTNSFDEWSHGLHFKISLIRPWWPSTHIVVLIKKVYHGLQIRFTRVTVKTNTGSYKKIIPRTTNSFDEWPSRQALVLLKESVPRITNSFYESPSRKILVLIKKSVPRITNSFYTSDLQDKYCFL